MCILAKNGTLKEKKSEEEKREQFIIVTFDQLFLN